MKCKRKFLMASALRQDVMERDKTCLVCGQPSPLTSHHICGRQEYPFLLGDLDNVVCLCRNCHEEYHHMYEDVNPYTWTQFLLKKREIENEVYIERSDKTTLYVNGEYVDRPELINNDISLTIIIVLENNDFTRGELIKYILRNYNTSRKIIEKTLRKLEKKRRVIILPEGEREILKAIR